MTTFLGGLDTTAATTTSLAGTVATTDMAIDLGATTLTDTTTVIGGAGTVNVLSLAGAGQALTFQDPAASGAVTVTGGFALGRLDAAAGTFDLSLLSSGTVTGATTLANSGTNTIGDAAGDVFSFNDGLMATAGSSVLFGNFGTAAKPITLSSASLAGTTNIMTSGGNVTATDVDGGAAALTLDLGEGELALASFANGGDIVLAEAGATTITAGFGAASLALNAGARFTVGGDLAITGDLVNNGVDAFAVDGAMSAANLDLNAGTSFLVGGDLAITGDFVNDGVDAIVVNGATSTTNLTSNAQNGVLVFNGATAVGNALSITNGAPVGIGATALTFNGSLAVGAGGIAIAAQPIAVVFNNDVTVAGLTSLRNTAGATLGSGDGSGSGDTLVFGGGLKVAGASSIYANLSTAGAADVTFDEALTLTGATTMTTAGGTLTATGGIDAIAANVAISTNGGNLTIGEGASGAALTSASGTVALATGGGVLLAGPIDSQGGDLTLSSAGGAMTLGAVTYAGAGDTLSISTSNGALTADAITAAGGDLSITAGSGNVNLASVADAAAFTLTATRGSSNVTIGQVTADSFALNGAATYTSTADVAVLRQMALNEIDTVTLQGNTVAGALALTSIGSFTAGSEVAPVVVRVADLLDINATSTLTNFGTLIAGTLDGSGSSGAITLNGGAAITSDEETTFANGGGLTLNALSVNQFTDPALSTVTLASGAEITVQDGLFVFGGAVDTTASGTTGDALGLVLNDASVITDSGAITTGAVSLNGNGALDTTLLRSPQGGAAITSTGDVNGDFAFSALAGAGDIDLQGTVSVASLFVRSGNALTLNAVNTSGNSVRALVTGDVNLNGDIVAENGDVLIVTSGGSLTQFVEVVDANAQTRETTGQGAIVRAEQGSIILGAQDSMTINLVESVNGDIMLALFGPATTDGSVVRGINRAQSFGTVSVEDSTGQDGIGSNDLIASGTVSIISNEEADFGTRDNGFLINATSQFITLGGGNSFIQASNASSQRTLDGAVAQAFSDALNPITDDPVRQQESPLNNLVFQNLDAALANPSNAIANRTSSVSDSEGALSQLSEEEELLTNLSEDVFQEITLVNQDQQPLCLPESLQGFDSVGCSGDSEQTVSWMDDLTRQIVGRGPRGTEGEVITRQRDDRPLLLRALEFGSIGEDDDD